MAYIDILEGVQSNQLYFQHYLSGSSPEHFHNCELGSLTTIQD